MRKSTIIEDLLEMIKLSLWGKGKPTITKSLFEEMKLHAISALPGSVLTSSNIPSELLSEWKKAVLRNVSFYNNYLYVQSQLPVQVPYVILKGTSAAQYYPHPEYRTMGDIDIMTSRENYEMACKMMTDDDWQDVTNGSDLKRGRHRTYRKNGIDVEIHAFFASMNDVTKAKLFDDLIVNNITDDHILPDPINGLVLVEHINQHLEEGLGFRQIIDWMLFVANYLSDEKWKEFEKITEKTGLTKLAVTTTRMCEMYLGLTPHKWCADVKEGLCEKLMQYVMQCGNFGNKLERSEVLAISRTYRLRHPIQMLRELQKKGVENWENTRPRFFMPFAWIWQGLKVMKETPGLKKGYSKSRNQNVLFKALGVKRIDDGLVYYENGEYIVKK